jgi:integrase
MPLFAEFALDEYLPHAKATKKSADMDESRLKLYLIPRFGQYRLDDLPTQEIQRMHNQLKETLAPATANRILCLVHHMLELAIQWGHLEKNPADGIKKHPENNERQRYLSKDELRRVQEALEKLSNPVAAAYFRFLLLTGARKNEATFATWEHIDLEEGRWWIPETKAGKGRWVILNEPARALLKTVRSVPGNPYVFPGKVTGRPFGNAQDTFEKLKQLAGITDDLRIHDLRHTYASIAINQGATLYEVQHLLGHSNSQTTQRYAHMAEDTLRKVSGKVGESVGQQQQTVVEIGIGTGS